MKQFNKQILEAVNRGIKLALDNFDDNEVPVSQSISKVKSRDLTSEWLDLMQYVVDLGLPSGTLWAKYNLGVKYNPEAPEELDKAKKWYGNYYAWGETKTKSYYDPTNYKWSKGATMGATIMNYVNNTLTKYCSDPRFGYNGKTDNLTKLLPEDDAATKILGHGFHIPTKKQCEELLKYTTNKWVENYYGIDDLNGIVFISKQNNNRIFIPAAGNKEIGMRNYTLNKFGYLWCANNDDAEEPYLVPYLNIFNYDVDIPNDGYRWYGFNIRPVIG